MSRAISSLGALVLLLAASAPASAQGRSSIRNLVTTMTDDGGHEHPSPLFDHALAEFRAFGDGPKVSGRERDGYVAFTFDDGPSHATTPTVKAALERYDVPATFFVVGRRLRGKGRGIEKNRQLLRELHDDGFHIANHTVSHANLRASSTARVRQEIDVAAAIIAEIIGHMPHAFRPPYGAGSDQVSAHLDDRKFTEVRWSIDTKDFLARSANTLRQRTVKAILAQNGGIVLMHDTKPLTARAITGILDDLEAENCRRLGRGDALIVPVSLHYFIRDERGTLRPIPRTVAARTERYRTALPARCKARK